MTPAGHAFAEQLQEEVRSALAPFTDRLGSDDRNLLTQLLDSVSGTSTVDVQPGALS